MAPLAPVITQTVAEDLTPCPTGTVLADITQPPEETDPGPFTYSCGPAPPGNLSVDGTTLIAADDLLGSNWTDVVATSAAGDSPPTRATIMVGGDDGGGEEEVDDSYEGNPQIPPPLPPGAEVPWELFIGRATNMIRPHARDGVDYVVAKPARDEPMASVHWDDAVLGPRPDAEIEALARELAAASPYTP